MYINIEKEYIFRTQLLFQKQQLPTSYFKKEHLVYLRPEVLVCKHTILFSTL